MPFDVTPETFQELELTSKRLQRLQGVLDILKDKQHWCKGEYRKIRPNEDTRYCLVGALNSYCGTPSGYRTLAFAKDLGFTRAQEVFAFNDRGGTTHSDVINLLTTSIEKEKQALLAKAMK